MKPKISVIVCSFNHEKWISYCLRSLKKQELVNHDDYEIIVVNDASQDNTEKILKKFKNIKNIKIYNNKENIGLPKSINKAIKKSKGNYIVRVDSDDYVENDFLFLLKKFLEKNLEYNAVASDYFEIDDRNKIIKKGNCKKRQIACGIMFDKKSLYQVGLYNEKFKMREGHELKKRFEKKFKIARLEFPLYNYRKHESNRTKQTKILKKYNKLLRKN